MTSLKNPNSALSARLTGANLVGSVLAFLNPVFPSMQPRGSAITLLNIWSESKNCVPLMVVSQWPS